jgi:hypothetical protein
MVDFLKGTSPATLEVFALVKLSLLRLRYRVSNPSCRM